MIDVVKKTSAEGVIFSDIGNDDILDGIEIVGDDEDFYKILAVKTYEECREECKKRFFCRSWYLRVSQSFYFS